MLYIHCVNYLQKYRFIKGVIILVLLVLLKEESSKTRSLVLLEPDLRLRNRNLGQTSFVKSRIRVRLRLSDMTFSDSEH